MVLGSTDLILMQKFAEIPPFTAVTAGIIGIGGEVACALATDRMQVLMTGRASEKRDEHCVGLTPSILGALRFEAADVVDRAALKVCLDHAIATFGTPRWLAACAGICEPGHFLILSAHPHEKENNVNSPGALHAVRNCAPAMLAARFRHIAFIFSAGIFGAFHSYSAHEPSQDTVTSIRDTFTWSLLRLVPRS